MPLSELELKELDCGPYPANIICDIIASRLPSQHELNLFTTLVKLEQRNIQPSGFLCMGQSSNLDSALTLIKAIRTFLQEKESS
jgi:hypothetical protein